MRASSIDYEENSVDNDVNGRWTSRCVNAVVRVHERLHVCGHQAVTSPGGKVVSCPGGRADAASGRHQVHSLYVSDKRALD